MADAQPRRLLMMVLGIGLAISVVLAIQTEWRRRRVAEAYTASQAIVQQLEADSARLDQELDQVRQTLESQASDMTALEAQLQHLQARLTQTEQELGTLRLANASLSEEKAVVTQENQAFKTKLSSIKELKTALRDLKRQMWQQRWQVWLASIERKRAENQQRLAGGNGGYVVRDGLPTLGSSSLTKLQVRVLEPQAQTQ